VNIYERFIEAQNKIINNINQKDKLDFELSEIKKEIYKKHIERFKAKPSGKTVIEDSGFEINYSRPEKITLLTELVKKDKFQARCIKEKVTPEKKELTLSKTDYKKLSDEEKAKVDKYLNKELGKASLSVKPLE
jgi:MarR-like DNA-binding transcriptional regulator SgrR of sgrS sRNA